MKRLLLRSEAFVRAAKRLVKKQPGVAQSVGTALELLTEDAFHSRLRTHKLKGELAGLWSCSAAYDLRIVFELIQHDGADAILLQTVGTHEEVY